jgi:type II secretory pathway component PulM
MCTSCAPSHIDGSARKEVLHPKIPATFGLIVRYLHLLGTTMATEEVVTTELPEEAEQTAEISEQPTDVAEGDAEAVEVVESSEDDQTAVEPGEALASDGSGDEAPSASEGTGEGG